MNPQRQQLIELLQADEELMQLLPDNNAFWNEDIEKEPRFSIIPVDKLRKGMKLPILTVQLGNDNLIATKLSDTFVYIRCYNETDKTFVAIDEILSRVKTILHGHRFEQYADNAVSIDTVYETTGPESEDQAFPLNYRESRYRVLYL